MFFPLWDRTSPLSSSKQTLYPRSLRRELKLMDMPLQRLALERLTFLFITLYLNRLYLASYQFFVAANAVANNVKLKTLRK